MATTSLKTVPLLPILKCIFLVPVVCFHSLMLACRLRWVDVAERMAVCIVHFKIRVRTGSGKSVCRRPSVSEIFPNSGMTRGVLIFP